MKGLGGQHIRLFAATYLGGAQGTGESPIGLKYTCKGHPVVGMV